MTQRELNHEVARATGESLGTISGMGFSLIVTPKRRSRPNRPGSRARQRMRRRLKVRATPTRSVLPPVPVPMPCIAA